MIWLLQLTASTSTPTQDIWGRRWLILSKRFLILLHLEASPNLSFVQKVGWRSLVIIYEKEEGLVSWHQTLHSPIMPSIGETPAAAKDAKNIQWDEGESKD